MLTEKEINLIQNEWCKLKLKDPFNKVSTKELEINTGIKYMKMYNNGVTEQIIEDNVINHVRQQFKILYDEYKNSGQDALYWQKFFDIIFPMQLELKVLGYNKNCVEEIKMGLKYIYKKEIMQLLNDIDFNIEPAKSILDIYTYAFVGSMRELSDAYMYKNDIYNELLKYPLSIMIFQKIHNEAELIRKNVYADTFFANNDKENS